VDISSLLMLCARVCISAGFTDLSVELASGGGGGKIRARFARVRTRCSRLFIMTSCLYGIG